MTDISESKESVKQELEGSVDFVVGVLVFGAVVFAVLFNLCFLAVENDVAVKRAYLVVSHPELSTPAQLEEALTQLTELLLDDVRDGGRPVLCEEDEALFSLSPHLPPASAVPLPAATSPPRPGTGHTLLFFLFSFLADA